MVPRRSPTCDRPTGYGHRMHSHRIAVALALALVLALAACGDDGQAADGTPTADTATAAPSAASSAGGGEPAGEQRYPDIVDVVVTPAGDGTFDLAVTVSSPYDAPERYADGWRVLAPDGTELGSHTLLHDHAGEQPFTRTQSGVEIPADVSEVTVEGRDQQYGYGGGTATADVPHDA
jgi:hypothetical protein